MPRKKKQGKEKIDPDTFRVLTEPPYSLGQALLLKKNRKEYEGRVVEILIEKKDVRVRVFNEDTGWWSAEYRLDLKKRILRHIHRGL